MNEFTIVTTIGRPVDEVFAVIRDVARTPVWTPGLTEGRQTSEGPLEPGATLVYRGTFLGRSYETPGLTRAETVSRIGQPARIFTVCGTLLSGHGIASQGSHWGFGLRNSDGGWAVETLCAWMWDTRHGRSGSCRAAATASARARRAWQRVIDCCTVMRSCATDHRSRASGQAISIPGSRRSSSSDSEIERV
jgi:hypothetical protein